MAVLYKMREMQNDETLHTICSGEATAEIRVHGGTYDHR